MTVIWKIIQKQIYDLLSNKYSVFLLLLISASILVTGFQFGESWLEWSRDKYQSMFNQFNDNINEKNLQRILCQSVPIDVVYTWVNGTDPELLKQLQEVRATTMHDKEPTHCFYRNCVPSHFLAARGTLPHSILDNFNEAVKVSVVQLKNENWTLISFPSSELAKQAQVSSGSINNITFHLAHWTTDAAAVNAVPMQHFISILGVHSGLDNEGVIRALPWSLQPNSLWLYLDRGLAVAYLSTALSSHILSKTYSNITLDGKEATIRTTFLILKMPTIKNPEDFSSSRFEDKEELRYSLRSLQKYAPWIRHVFLITNGQIPYWLNLDQPRLTIVTHDELFLNKSHLPTFSSPAIESHIHRIPGLSDRFLYLNDDVMFGKEVWPEDFFTETKGQKVYLSWPIPECHEGCPSSWIADGYCDRACNKSDCMWDGGDCKDGTGAARAAADVDSILVPDSDGEGIEPWPGAADDPGSCASNCADSWLADKYCDANCNVFECGYDAGDCGTTHYHKLNELKLLPGRADYLVPNGLLMAYWNMSQILKSSEITAGEFEDAPVVRTWALCLKFQVLTLILRPGYNFTKLHGSLRGTKDREYFELKFDVKVNTSVPKHSVMTPRYLHDMGRQVNTRPPVIPFMPFTGLPSDVRLEPRLLTTKPPVNLMESHISKDMEEKILALHSQLQTGKITKLGFARKKIALLNQPQAPPVRKMLAYDNPGIGDHIGFLPWEKNDLESEDVKFSGRKLLDTFGESLLHVNRLYNREFGFEARRVPAHMAHLIDKNIMNEVQKRFPHEWDITSSNKIRSSMDMQYAFSYFYFLMSERVKVSAAEIFDKFDTDNSGTWSDREIRTLLTQLHDLPLSFTTVTNFEMQIINCSHQLPKHLYEGVTVPLYERYVDSKMPTVTRELVVQCKDVATQLTKKFGNRKKYKYEIVGEEDVLFKMLTSNLSHVIGSLDEVRRRPKKFICLNDNMDPSREKDNIIVRAVLQDFYESILPIPSNFELPQMYRNRFLHVSELRSWRQYRSVIHSVTLVCIILLLAFTIALICQGEGRPWYRRLYKRMRNSSRTCRV